MEIDLKDFAAWSATTGNPYPRTPEQRAAVLPEVRAWKAEVIARNQAFAQQQAQERNNALATPAAVLAGIAGIGGLGTLGYATLQSIRNRRNSAQTTPTEAPQGPQGPTPTPVPSPQAQNQRDQRPISVKVIDNIPDPVLAQTIEDILLANNVPPDADIRLNQQIPVTNSQVRDLLNLKSPGGQNLLSTPIGASIQTALQNNDVDTLRGLLAQVQRNNRQLAPVAEQLMTLVEIGQNPNGVLTGVDGTKVPGVPATITATDSNGNTTYLIRDPFYREGSRYNSSPYVPLRNRGLTTAYEEENIADPFHYDEAERIKAAQEREGSGRTTETFDDPYQASYRGKRNQSAQALQPYFETASYLQGRTETDDTGETRRITPDPQLIADIAAGKVRIPVGTAAGSTASNTFTTAADLDEIENPAWIKDKNGEWVQSRGLTAFRGAEADIARQKRESEGRELPTSPKGISNYPSSPEIPPVLVNGELVPGTGINFESQQGRRLQKGVMARPTLDPAAYESTLYKAINARDPQAIQQITTHYLPQLEEIRKTARVNLRNATESETLDIMAVIVNDAIEDFNKAVGIAAASGDPNLQRAAESAYAGGKQGRSEFEDFLRPYARNRLRLFDLQQATGDPGSPATFQVSYETLGLLNAKARNHSKTTGQRVTLRDELNNVIAGSNDVGEAVLRLDALDSGLADVNISLQPQAAGPSAGRPNSSARTNGELLAQALVRAPADLAATTNLGRQRLEVSRPQTAFTDQGMTDRASRTPVRIVFGLPVNEGGTGFAGRAANTQEAIASAANPITVTDSEGTRTVTSDSGKLIPPPVTKLDQAIAELTRRRSTATGDDRAAIDAEISGLTTLRQQTTNPRNVQRLLQNAATLNEDAMAEDAMAPEGAPRVGGALILDLGRGGVTVQPDLTQRSGAATSLNTNVDATMVGGQLFDDEGAPLAAATQGSARNPYPRLSAAEVKDIQQGYREPVVREPDTIPINTREINRRQNVADLQQRIGRAAGQQLNDEIMARISYLTSGAGAEDPSLSNFNMPSPGTIARMRQVQRQRNEDRPAADDVITSAARRNAAALADAFRGNLPRRTTQPAPSVSTTAYPPARRLF